MMTWHMVLGALVAVAVLAAAGTLTVGLVRLRRARHSWQRPSIMTPDGRRAWSFAAIVGGCMVFTVFAAVGVWLLAGHALYTLILALAAHLQLLVGMTALGWALGRRMKVTATRSGATLSDQLDELAMPEPAFGIDDPEDK